jgi:hypothetical protein
MKLQELKAKVYQLAGVSTTQQLKAQHSAIQSLDLRRKADWEKALIILQPQPPASASFNSWLENPPEEYQTLFAEIEQATQQYNRTLTQAEQLTQEVLTAADALDALASETQAEANQLKQQVNAARQISKQAKLN